MTVRKIVISLDGAELSALNTYAQSERRDARDQAALIIRRELERRKLIESRRAIARQTSGVKNADG
jgi:hypothetical protein